MKPITRPDTSVYFGSMPLK